MRQVRLTLGAIIGRDESTDCRPMEGVRKMTVESLGGGDASLSKGVIGNFFVWSGGSAH